MSEDNETIQAKVEPETGADGVAAGASDGAPSKKRRPSRKFTIVAIVVVAVVAVGVGFYKWHETPEFCTAICHTPMDDAYLETLYANPYEPATDKWGNDVERASGMLASLHGKMGKKCMDCHVPSIEEQVTEGLEWIAGNYYNPLSERDLARLVYYRGVGETEFCLNEACHDITKTGLTQLTSDFERNPHSWHHFEYTCSDCHKAHRASVMVCSQCHEDYELPDGWITWQEEQDLDTQYLSWNEQQILES